MTEFEATNYTELNEEFQKMYFEIIVEFTNHNIFTKKGTKHLIYFGEQYGNDPNDSRLDAIQKYLSRYKLTI